MCGRYALHASPEVVRLQFGLASVPDFAPRYNVCPGTDILAVRAAGARLLPWGRIANARAETLAEKPIFAGAFRRFRCLVPASGFYEWKSAAGRKQPYYVRPADAPLFGLAGIVLLWRGERSVSLITTTPNELMRSIHDRMPVIVTPEDYADWLGPGLDASGMLRSYPADRMTAHAVSARVNRPEQDDAALIEGLTAP
ncbi:MAG TPA: SOS response-associated peptidase [Burkholderiales bacterium]|nr:SOS response-associated peptidase [Burkholderiales bacterium]